VEFHTVTAAKENHYFFVKVTFQEGEKQSKAMFTFTDDKTLFKIGDCGNTINYFDKKRGFHACSNHVFYFTGLRSGEE